VTHGAGVGGSGPARSEQSRAKKEDRGQRPRDARRRARTSRSSGSAAWLSAITPKKLTSISRRYASTCVVSTRPRAVPPAQLTSPASGRPDSRTAAIAASICSCLVTSRMSGRMRPWLIARSRLASTSFRTPQNGTKLVSAASATQMSKPIPVEPPLTSTAPPAGGGGLLDGESAAQLDRDPDHADEDEEGQTHWVGALACGPSTSWTAKCRNR
jgi:hypothetical protein